MESGSYQADTHGDRTVFRGGRRRYAF